MPPDVLIPTCSRLAVMLVDSGRVVPGVVVHPDGRLRSQWWPLPTAADRQWLAALLPDDSPESQQVVADTLAEAVDRLVRQRLVSPSADSPQPRLTAPRGRRRRRPSLVEGWLVALASADPFLPVAADPATEAALLGAIHTWIRDGAAAAGDLQICLRVHDPSDGRRRRWLLEPLLRSSSDPSLMVPLAEFWACTSPFPRSRFDAVLTQLGVLARLAPELSPLLDHNIPAGLALEEGSLLNLLRQRSALLSEAGFALLLPSWWRQGRRPGLKAKASHSKTQTPSSEGAGLGLDSIFQFEWQAVLGGQPLSPTELAALRRAAEAKRSLVRLRGEWTLIDPASIDALLRHGGMAGEASGADLLRAGLGIGQLGLPDLLELAGVELAGPLGELLAGDLHQRAESIPTPADFQGQLRPYQERGLGWLVFLGRLGLGACLADDMGLGKTAQLIASLLADPLEGPTLVVAPVSLLGNWSRELARFSPQLPVLIHHGSERFRGKAPALRRQLRALGPKPVLLTTYGVVSRDCDLLAGVPFARLVFDEAQQLKNPYTAQSRAAASLRGERRVAMTGTPVENRLSELWALMQLLNPGLLGSLRHFREQFAIPIERDQNQEVARQLQRLTAPFILRRLKSDRSIVPDLPGKIEQSEPCSLTTEQATLYQAVVEELLEAAAEAEGIDRRAAVLAGLTRLKQVCNHPAHFLADGSALPGRSGKLSRCEDLLDAILDAGEKVLVFTQFAAWGELLRNHLHRRCGEEPLWLHGGLPRRQRDALVERFCAADGPSVFLLSLKAGGTGLNLTAAAHVIHYDRWWNPAVEDQATDRAHRIGQRRTVHVHKLVCGGTIEERIDAMIQRKRALADQVVGSGEQWLTELGTDELREVIRLRTEALTP